MPGLPPFPFSLWTREGLCYSCYSIMYAVLYAPTSRCLQKVERERKRKKERERERVTRGSENVWEAMATSRREHDEHRAWILLVAALLIFMVPEWEVLDQSYLAGEYYSVNPVAINNPKVDVLTENCRSVTQLELAPGIHNILITYWSYCMYVCMYVCMYIYI